MWRVIMEGCLTMDYFSIIKASHEAHSSGLKCHNRPYPLMCIQFDYAAFHTWRRKR